MGLRVEQRTPESMHDYRLELFHAILLEDGLVMHKASPPTHMFVGYILDTIVGMSEASIKESNGKYFPHKYGEISYYVHPTQRGHQYGETLMDHVIHFVYIEMKLPVTASVLGGSYSEWLLLTRGFVDYSKAIFGNLPTQNRYLMKKRS